MADGWLLGTSDNDSMNGTAGPDNLNGLAGNDVLFGNTGNDHLYAGLGNDTAYGGNGVNVLRGESGNDLLDGGTGTNYLSGGSGNDRFVAARGSVNVIRDFLPGDVIQLDNSGSTSLQLTSNGSLFVGQSANPRLERFDFSGVALEPPPAPPPPPERPVVLDLSDTSWTTLNAPSLSPGTVFNDTLVFNQEIGYVVNQPGMSLPYNGLIEFTFSLADGPLLGEPYPREIALVFLFMQRSGDNLSGFGIYNAYRMWSLSGVNLTNLGSGTFRVEVPLLESAWAGVTSGISQSEFMAMIAAPRYIGFTFGDSQSKGHGNTDAGGIPARFTVTSFKNISLTARARPVKTSPSVVVPAMPRLA